MRLFIVCALLLIAAFSGAPASAAPPKDSAPPASADQDIPREDLEGIVLRHLAYRVDNLNGSLLPKPLAGALLCNYTRYAFTSVTLRLDLRDGMGNLVLSKPFTITSFPVDASTGSDAYLMPDDTGAGTYVIGQAPPPPAGWQSGGSLGGYWIEAVSARGKPVALKQGTPSDALMVAAAYGDMALLTTTAAAHPEWVNARGPQGVTPLDEATVGHHLAVARFLLAHGADLETKDDLGDTPLSWAIGGEDVAMVQLLLARHADPLARNKSGTTCLDKAHTYSHELSGAEVVQLLTDASQGNWPQEDGPLPSDHVASAMVVQNASISPEAAAGRPVQDILPDELDGVVVSNIGIAVQDANGELLPQPHATALILNESRFAITSLTLRLDVFDKNRKVVFSVPFTVTQFDPPPSGAKGGHLLPASASWIQGQPFTLSPEMRTDDDRFLITLVSGQGHPVSVEQVTPQQTLAAACSLGDLAAAKSVLAAHPEFLNTVAPVSGALPPLVWAAAHHHMAVARFLLDQGAKVDVLDSRGRTALSRAVDSEGRDMVRLLLSRHADTMAKGKNGVTALQLAHDQADTREVTREIDRMVTDASQGKWPADETHETGKTSPPSP